MQKNREKALVLVKAEPHVSHKHGETVCCAAVTAEGNWRRIYPISFRNLAEEQKFKRWQWIEYEWRVPIGDKRPESRHVQTQTLTVANELPPSQRARFLTPLVRISTEDAAARGETLALIRPTNLRLQVKTKSPTEISQEKAGYANAVRQVSFLTKELDPLEPCPYRFRFLYEDETGGKRTSTADDWETTATFFNFRKRYGEQAAVTEMRKIFGVDYPAKGVVFAMGTHSQRPKQWLLVGIIRLNETDQGFFEF